MGILSALQVFLSVISCNFLCVFTVSFFYEEFPVSDGSEHDQTWWLLGLHPLVFSVFLPMSEPWRYQCCYPPPYWPPMCQNTWVHEPLELVDVSSSWLVKSWQLIMIVSEDHSAILRAELVWGSSKSTWVGEGEESHFTYCSASVLISFSICLNQIPLICWERHVGGRVMDSPHLIHRLETERVRERELKSNKVKVSSSQQE